MTPRSMTVRPIGSIHTEYSDRSTTPVQSALNPHDRGQVVLDPQFHTGLSELDGFDFVWLFTWLDPQPEDPDPVRLLQVPFLLTDDPRPIGTFAMRGPRRPNPIGLHLVRLIALHADGFEFSGVDMLHGTPLLDIKPWAAVIDLPHGHTLTQPVRSGWFDTADLSGPHTPDSLRANRRT